MHPAGRFVVIYMPVNAMHPDLKLSAYGTRNDTYMVTCIFCDGFVQEVLRKVQRPEELWKHSLNSTLHFVC